MGVLDDVQERIDHLRTSGPLCEACGFEERGKAHTRGFCRAFVPPVPCVICREPTAHPIHDVDFGGGHPYQPPHG